MIVLGIAFFVFLLLGVPIAFVFGISAVLAVVIADLPLVLVAHRFYAGLNDFTLMAIPFFLLAGMLMDSGGLSRRIMDFAGALVGWECMTTQTGQVRSGAMTDRIGAGSTVTAIRMTSAASRRC